MARFYQTAFWLLVVGVISVHCYPSTSLETKDEETLGSAFKQLDDDSDIRTSDIAASDHGVGRVRRDKKMTGVEKKKADHQARRRAQIRRAVEMLMALERAREFDGYVAVHRQAGLSEADAILRASREHPELADQVLADFNPEMEEQ